MTTVNEPAEKFVPCATRIRPGNDVPSRWPWKYAHAASIEGAHWNIYTAVGDVNRDHFIGMVVEEADAKAIVDEHNAALTAERASGGLDVETLAGVLRAEGFVRGVANRYGTFNDIYWQQSAEAILARLAAERASDRLDVERLRAVVKAAYLFVRYRAGEVRIYDEYWYDLTDALREIPLSIYGDATPESAAEYARLTGEGEQK